MAACHAGGLNIVDFGAKGDGVTDDTAAIQRALDAAAPKNGTVYVPEGVFCCAGVHLPPHTGLVGEATWGYRGDKSGSCLKLNSDRATCLVDITGAVGATVNGLFLDGAGLGNGIHGIFMGPPAAPKKEEDAPRIERVQVCKFTGNGIHLSPAWCFSLRSSQIAFNKGDGLFLGGWDGFILDCWFSGNGGAGIAAREHTASVTITGNRVEWNKDGGIRLHGANHYNITGNYIDRSGGPGIVLAPRGEGKSPCFCTSIVGNVIYRSGKPEWTTAGEETASCHILLDGAHGITCTGNTMCVGQDDGGGVNSPDYGIIMRGLENCIVKDNALHIGALKEIVRDLGGHGDGVVEKDNVGSLYRPKTLGEAIWVSGQI